MSDVQCSELVCEFLKVNRHNRHGIRNTYHMLVLPEIFPVYRHTFWDDPQVRETRLAPPKVRSWESNQGPSWLPRSHILAILILYYLKPMLNSQAVSFDPCKGEGAKTGKWHPKAQKVKMAVRRMAWALGLPSHLDLYCC